MFGMGCGATAVLDFRGCSAQNQAIIRNAVKVKWKYYKRHTSVSQEMDVAEGTRNKER